MRSQCHHVVSEPNPGMIYSAKISPSDPITKPIITLYVGAVNRFIAHSNGFVMAKMPTRSETPMIANAANGKDKMLVIPKMINMCDVLIPGNTNAIEITKPVTTHNMIFGSVTALLVATSEVTSD